MGQGLPPRGGRRRSHPETGSRRRNSTDPSDPSVPSVDAALEAEPNETVSRRRNSAAPPVPPVDAALEAEPNETVSRQRNDGQLRPSTPRFEASPTETVSHQRHSTARPAAPSRMGSWSSPISCPLICSFAVFADVAQHTENVDASENTKDRRALLKAEDFVRVNVK